MKNHEWVDGQLLQTNKKYSHLKQAQKDKIHRWMYHAYKQFFLDQRQYRYFYLEVLYNLLFSHLQLR